MTRKSQAPGLMAENDQLRAQVNTMAEQMGETRATNDKLHQTVTSLSKRLDNQACINDKFQATIDKLVLVTQSLSETAMANNDKNE